MSGGAIGIVMHYLFLITVVEEIEKGDLEAARLRLQTIQGISVLNLNGDIERLAESFLASGAIPGNSGADARHIAFAAVYGMDFLITWNQKHIAAERNKQQIEAIIEEYGLKPPRLFTPEQHMIFEETNVLSVEQFDLWNLADEGDPLVWLRKHREEIAQKYPTFHEQSEYYKQFGSIEEALERVQKKIAEKKRQENQ